LAPLQKRSDLPDLQAVAGKAGYEQAAAPIRLQTVVSRSKKDGFFLFNRKK